MARSLGVSLQPDGFAFAVVDGSAKRHAVKAHGRGGLDPEIEDAPRAIGKALAKALKQAGVGRVDQVVFALPSLETVLRELNLPFTERDKVRQVLKFEIESDLYHRSIDEVVCDFLELHDERSTPTILVAAEPKKNLAAALEIAAGAGLEPATLEVDCGALACAVSERQPPADGASPELEAFLYVGPLASLLLVLGPQGLRSLRSIKLGWRELGRSLVPRPATVTAAASPATAKEGELKASAKGAAEAGGQESEAADAGPAPLFGVDPQLPLVPGLEQLIRAASADAMGALLRRLTAEVRRGLAAVSSATVARLHLLGAHLPGLDEALQTRLGVPTSAFELPAGEGEAPDALAFGAALRGLGAGQSKMNFRQEEYRFTRGLERVEGPLTFALFGILAYLLVSSVIRFKEIGVMKADTDALLQVATGRVEAYNNALSPENKKDFFIQTAFTNIGDLDRLGVLRSRVDSAKRKLDELVGEAGVEMPQSCLEAWRLLMNLLQQEMPSYPERWMIELFDFTSHDKTSRDPAHVAVTFQVTLFGEGLGVDQKWDSLQRALREQPWCLKVSAEGGLLAADTPGARTGQIEVQVQVDKAVAP